VPIIRRKLLYPCVSGTCHTVWVVSSWIGTQLQSNQQTRHHPYSVTSTSDAWIQ